MTAEASARSNAAPSPGFSVMNVLVATVPLALVVLAVFAWLYNQAQRDIAPPVDFLASVKLALVAPTSLAEGLLDQDEDLVADAPREPEKWLDPDTLVFEVLGRDLELEQQQWSDFITHLQQVTGKQVQLTLRPESISASSSEAVPPALQQAHEFRSGKVHLACINTGAVALSVNAGGAVPFCVMADDDGKFGYEMEIIVPAKSSIQQVAQLKGSKKVLFASMYSHSGFKAPLMILWKEFDLQPERDYTPVFVSGQEQAITAIAAGKGDAAPVASDLLRRIVDREAVAKESFRSIHKSKPFPPACFAHGHQLNPELAEKVKTAFLEYKWPGTSLEKAYAAAQQSRFVPANYKVDWLPVREVESHISSLLQSKNRGS